MDRTRKQWKVYRKAFGKLFKADGMKYCPKCHGVHFYKIVNIKPKRRKNRFHVKYTYVCAKCQKGEQ